MRGFLEIDDGSEDATLQTLLGQLGKVAFHGIEPGARCRREVEDEALVPVEPGAHLRMLVRCVVVEDEMDDFPAGTSASMVFRKRTNS